MNPELHSIEVESKNRQLLTLITRYLCDNWNHLLFILAPQLSILYCCSTLYRTPRLNQTNRQILSLSFHKIRICGQNVQKNVAGLQIQTQNFSVNILKLWYPHSAITIAVHGLVSGCHIMYHIPTSDNTAVRQFVAIAAQTLSSDELTFGDDGLVWRVEDGKRHYDTEPYSCIRSAERIRRN